MPRKIESLFYELRAQTEGLQADLQGAERQFGKLSTFIDNNPTASALALGAALAGVAAKATTMALQLDREMVKVRTVVDGTRETMDGLSDGVRRIFASLPVESTQELTQALFDIVGAGVPAADALRVLEVSARAAVAGVTDTATAANAILSVTAAYREFGVTAEDASDKIFAAVQRGRGEFADYAASIGSVASIAAAYNISLDDLLGTTAQLSLTLPSVAESVTGIRSAITNIINPTAEFAQQFPQLAREFNATKLEGVGFTQFLVEFHKASNGSKDALNALFSDIQGKNAVLALLADGGKAAAEQVAAVQQAAGGTADALTRVEQTASAAHQTLRNQLSDTLLELGQQILPVVNAGLHGMVGLLAQVQSAGVLPSLAEFYRNPVHGTAQLAGDFARTRTRQLIVGAPQPALDRDPTLAASLAGGPTGRTTTSSEDAQARQSLERIKLAAKATDIPLPQLRALQAELKAIAAGTTKVAAEAQGLLDGLSEKVKKASDKAADAARDLAKQVTAFTHDLARQAAQATATQVDDLELELAGLKKRAAELGQADTAATKSSVAAFELRIAKTREAEAAAERLVEATRNIDAAEADRAARAQQTQDLDGAFSAAVVGRITQEMAALETSAEALHFGLIGLSGDQVQALFEWEAALKTLAPQSAEAAALLVKVQGKLHGNREGGGSGGVTPSATPAKEWSDEIARGARALLDAGQAAGLLDANLASALGSAINLAESLPKALAGDPSAIVSSLAAVGNLAAQVFGTSEVDRRRDATDRANVEAVRALARAVGDLAGLDLGGAQLSAVRTGVGAAADAFRAGDVAGLARGGAILRGLDWNDVAAAARGLNIELDGSTRSIVRLAEAMRAADFAAFASSWAGAMAELDVLLDVDNIDSPLGQLLGLAERARGAGSAALTSFLNGVDLSTAEGRAFARQGARDRLDEYRAGTLDPSAFGDLNPQEFLAFLQRFINGIDDVETELTDAASAAETAVSALDRLRQRLADNATLGELLGADATSQLDAVAAAYADAVRESGFASFFDTLLQDLDLSTAAGIERLRARIAEYTRLLAEGGLTDAEREVLAGFLEILHGAEAIADEALRAAPAVDGLASSIGQLGAVVESVAQRVAGAASQAATDARRRGATDGGAQAQSDAYTSQLNVGGAVDLRNPADVARVLTNLRAIYSTLSETDTELKALFGNPIDFFAQYEQRLVAGAGVSTAPGGDQIASSLHALDRETGISVAELLRTDVTIARSQLDELRLIREAMTTPRFAALQPPPLTEAARFAGARGGGEGRAGPTTVHIALNNVQFHVQGTGSTTGDAQALAAEVLRILEAAIAMGQVDDALGDAYRRARWRFGIPDAEA